MKVEDKTRAEEATNAFENCSCHAAGWKLLKAQLIAGTSQNGIEGPTPSKNFWKLSSKKEVSFCLSAVQVRSTSHI